MFKLLLLTAILVSSAQASCIKDVFKAGAGLDSFVANGSRGSDEVNVVSDSGLSIRGHWIIYCPESGLEVTPYLYFRNYEFSDFDNGEELEEFNSFSMGITTSKIFDFGTVFVDIYQREELGIGKGQSEDEITDVIYENLGVLLGYGFNYYKGEKTRFDAKVALGVLSPSDTQFDVGVVTKFSTDFLYKLSSKYSLVFDLYLELNDQYNKDIDLDIQRQEFGLNTSVLFRL